MTERTSKGQTTPQKSVTNYRDLYQRWLDSPALSEAEWQELSAVDVD